MVDLAVGDFRELAEDLPDDSIDLILTDPPYPKEFLHLWGDLGEVAARVLKPSAYLVAYSGHIFLDQVFAMLNEHLTYYTLMVLAEPGNHIRIIIKAMFQDWKPILVYQKPPTKRANSWGSNVVVSPAPSKQYHEWGQSVEPVRELLERFSKPGALVLDPFFGGGTTGVACQQTGRRCIGYEIDANAAGKARVRLAGAQISLLPPVMLEAMKRERGNQPRKARCQFCGDVFPTNRCDARYCGDACRQAAYRRRVTARCNGVSLEGT